MIRIIPTPILRSYSGLGLAGLVCQAGAGSMAPGFGFGEGAVDFCMKDFWAKFSQLGQPGVDADDC